MTARRYCKTIALLALLVLTQGQPVAATGLPGVTVPAPMLLAWDRVGSPINIRASA